MTGEPSTIRRTFAPLDLPGLRTLRSARFRTLVAGALFAIGATVIAMLLARQAADPAGQYAIDFADYHRAAQRVAAGVSPYAPEMLQGPVDAQGTDRYRYPPPLAQVLVPTAGMTLSGAAFLWLVIQAAAIVAAMAAAARAGGRASRETLLWCGAAAVFFLPVFDTLWKGNVSGFLALLVVLAAGGARIAGTSTAIAVALKLVPVALVPGLAARGRGALAAAAVVGGAIALVSVVLAPAAWADYLNVLLNLLGGGADFPQNLAPAVIADRAGLPDPLPGLLRLATIGVALGCMAGAWSVGRRSDGVVAAVALGAASMLLLPAAIWYHYLVVLLPLAVIAWPRASRRLRAAIVAGGAAITIGIAWLPLATVGGVLLGAASVIACWPAPAPRASRGWSPARRRAAR